MTAESATFKKQYAVVTGDVRLEWKNQALEAPQLRYNQANGQVIANDGLRYRREGVNLKAESARVNIQDGTGTFIDTQYAVANSGARGEASRITSTGQGVYRLKQADYTTCPGPDPTWQLIAQSIELDRNSGRGEAFNTTLYFFDIPIFYSPYLNFPIDDKRHTGFLTPSFGFSDDSGFELATPFYVNIAPGRDATITPRLLTGRGLLVAGQFRYLNRHSKGTVEAEVLPSDNKFGDDRALFHFQHAARLSPHVALAADYGWASDDQYFEDLGSTLARTSHSQINQQIGLTFASPGMRFALLAQDFQEMDDDENGLFNQDPYARLPTAKLSLLSQTGALQVGLNANITNFMNDEAVEGFRYHLRPRIRWHIQKRGWFVNAEASYYYTRYDLERSNQVVRNRGIPSLSLDIGLRFQRVLDNGWIQTLEPRIKYLYTAYEEQSGLPVFDSGTPDLHYQQLFADNRFIGIDRIGDANQIAMGITSRLIEPTSGRTVLRLDLGRIISFRDLRVQLPRQNLTGYNDRHSDIVASAAYQPAMNWFTRVATQYDPASAHFNRSSVRMGYNDDQGRRLILGYHYFRDARPRPNAPGFVDLEQTELTLAWPLGQDWNVIGRWNYSLENSQTVNMLVGMEYRASCCWAIRAAWQHVVDDYRREYANAIMFQIELTGLARLGDDIGSLLTHDIVSSNSNFDYRQFQ